MDQLAHERDAHGNILHPMPPTLEPDGWHCAHCNEMGSARGMVIHYQVAHGLWMREGLLDTGGQ